MRVLVAAGDLEAATGAVLARSSRSRGRGRDVQEVSQNADHKCCRICLEDDDVKRLLQPCNCKGSIKYAHEACIQQWINEKGDKTCELCGAQYNGQYDDSSRKTGQGSLTSPQRAAPRRSLSNLLLAATDLDAGALAAAHQVPEQGDDSRFYFSLRGCAICWIALCAVLLLQHMLSRLPTTVHADGSSLLDVEPATDDRHPDNAGMLLLLLSLLLHLLLVGTPVVLVAAVLYQLRRMAMAEAALELSAQRPLFVLWQSVEFEIGSSTYGVASAARRLQVGDISQHGGSTEPRQTYATRRIAEDATLAAAFIPARDVDVELGW